MRFQVSILRQILAVTLALILLVCSPCWAGKPALSPAEQAWLEAHPVIRMSVDVGYGPYTFLDAEGHLQGVAVDFFADIERYLGIRFEIVSNLSWSQQMSALRERRLDVVATVVKLPERETFIEFTKIYLSTPLVIMTRSETPQLRSLKELQQLSLSLVEGYSSSKQLIVQFPDLRPRYVTVPLEGLRLVASGATDAYVGVLGVNSFLAVRNGITNLKVNAAFNMADNGQRFGVRKDWPQLARLLDKALFAISEERRNAVFQRWLPRHAGEIKRLSRSSYVTRLFPWLLGCLGLVLLGYFVLFVFNRRLRKAVETRTLELSRTNEKLRESEERYRAVAEETPVLICRFRPGGVITYANQAYCKYFDKTSEELLGLPFASLIPEAEREIVMANIFALTIDSPNQSHEHQVIGVGGEVRWVRWINRAQFNVQGEAVSYQSIGEDITERKHAEDELNRYKVRLEDRVKERAAELKEKNTELERINDLFVGRELRIKELRERVKELESTIEK
ncbi:MAG: transporter substrate-binding domain-containing protein, partial [Pseudomonadota bacterium]|nr:transporter substrate-binding domain-containing protein [Pseudomonadota bacterium]